MNLLISILKFPQRFLLVLCLVTGFLVAAIKPSVFTSVPFQYILYIVVPMTVILGYFYYTTGTSLLPLIGVGLIIAAIYAWKYANISLQVSKFFLAGFTIGSLGLFLTFFRHYIDTQIGVTGFIFQFIFFLPCLFVKFLEFLQQDYNSTPNTVFLLVMFEISCLIGYFYFPNSFSLGQKGTFVIAKPVVLSKEIKIPANHIPRNKIFSVAFEFYLNPNHSAESYLLSCTDLFYLSANKSADDNGVFTFRHSTHTFTFTLKNQRWNHIVINFNDAVVDLFVDKHLSFTCDKDPRPLNVRPEFIIGENGLSGAIKNIEVFQYPLSKIQIMAKDII